MNQFKLLLICAIVSLSTSSTFAANKIFQASLTPNVAIHDKSERIAGLTLSFWGNNPQNALALGLINGTSGESAGLSIGFANYGDIYRGIQLGVINNNKETEGLQVGLVCYTKKTTSCIQIGLINIIKENKCWFGNFPMEFAPIMLGINWRGEDKDAIAVGD